MLAHAQADWRVHDERWNMKQEDSESRKQNRKWREDDAKSAFPPTCLRTRVRLTCVWRVCNCVDPARKFMMDFKEQGRVDGDGKTGLDGEVDDGVSDDEDADREYFRNHMRQHVLPEFMAVRMRATTHTKCMCPCVVRTCAGV